MGGFVVSYKEKKSYSEVQKEKALRMLYYHHNSKLKGKRGITKSKKTKRK